MKITTLIGIVGVLLATSAAAQQPPGYPAPPGYPQPGSPPPSMSPPPPAGPPGWQQPVLIVPPGAVVSPGVVYAAPGYPAPAAGYVWAYHPRFGWGWHHPQYGWHRNWR